MNVVRTELEDVIVFEPRVFDDARGYFVEAFRAERMTEIGAGPVVQLNHSHSIQGVLRGLHFQEPHAQGKLVWAIGGEAFDVVVDVREGSPTFSRWVGITIGGATHRQVWIPAGFAHGFCAVGAAVDLFYGCTDYYAPGCERAIAWDDPDIGIEWPIDAPLLSDKDMEAPRLRDAPVLPSY